MLSQTHREAARRARLQALRAHDMAAYLALVATERSHLLQEALAQTDECLQRLARRLPVSVRARLQAAVRQQQGVAVRRTPGGKGRVYSISQFVLFHTNIPPTYTQPPRVHWTACNKPMMHGVHWQHHCRQTLPPNQPCCVGGNSLGFKCRDYDGWWGCLTHSSTASWRYEEWMGGVCMVCVWCV